MDLKIFINFLYNVSLILSASVIYSVLPKKQFEPQKWERYFYGIVLSLIGVIIMSTPYVVMPGIQFDARSLVVASSAMFLGIIPTIIVTVITAVYRILMGGDGAVVGVFVVLSSATIGSLWRVLYYKKLQKNKKKRLLNLYITSLMVHLAYLGLLVFLPNGIFLRVFMEVHIPLLTIYPVGLTIVGLVLFSQYDKHKAQKELEDYKDSLYTYIEEAPYGIFITDNDGNFIDANKMALDMSGYTLNELRNESTKTITSPNNNPEELESLGILKKYGKMNINKRYITKHMGERIWNVKAVRLDSDRIVGFTSDITEKLKLERENMLFETKIRNQQKLDSIGTLAGGVAHEINNPINGILNYGQLILDKEDIDDETNEYAKEIVFESNRIAEIVKDLLAFSRQEESDLILTDINNLINHTVSLIRTIVKGDQIELNVNLDKTNPQILCKGQQLQQVIMNLLTNSRDALNAKYKGYHENKVIELTCKTELHKGNEVLAIRVRDNGNGISKDIANKIFDPFFSSKGRSGGTGLGLAISYGIVNDHNGEIGYTTKESEYTEFFVLLPIND